MLVRYSYVHMYDSFREMSKLAWNQTLVTSFFQEFIYQQHQKQHQNLTHRPSLFQSIMSMYPSGNESPKGVANLHLSSPTHIQKQPLSQRKAYQDQTLVPVTIHTLLTSDGSPTGNGPITLNDGTQRDLHQVKLVGAIRDIEQEETSTTYLMEDGTGVMSVKYYHDSQTTSHSESSTSPLKENQYVRVIGQVKKYQDQTQMIAYSVRKVSSGNELIHHLLEVVYSAERAKQALTVSQNGTAVGTGSSIYDIQTPRKNLNTQFGAGGGSESSNKLNDSILEFLRNDDGKFSIRNY